MNKIKRLPDSYQKAEGSQNWKLMQLNSEAVEEIRQAAAMVFDMVDINKASGRTLDLYGEMVGQKRGLLDDKQYRYMIFTRIGRNIVTSDYESLMNTIIAMFDCEAGDVSLDDIEVTETETPCVLKLTKFPIQVLIDAGFSSRQAVAMIETLLPICVTLAADNFEGTFEFTNIADEYDKKAGFADEAGTIGGYLGLLLGEDDTIPVLPI